MNETEKEVVKTVTHIVTHAIDNKFGLDELVDTLNEEFYGENIPYYKGKKNINEVVNFFVMNLFTIPLSMLKEYESHLID